MQGYNILYLSYSTTGYTAQISEVYLSNSNTPDCQSCFHLGLFTIKWRYVEMKQLQQQSADASGSSQQAPTGPHSLKQQSNRQQSPNTPTVSAVLFRSL